MKKKCNPTIDIIRNFIFIHLYSFHAFWIWEGHEEEAFWQTVIKIGSKSQSAGFAILAITGYLWGQHQPSKKNFILWSRNSFILWLWISIINFLKGDYPFEWDIHLLFIFGIMIYEYSQKSFLLFFLPSDPNYQQDWPFFPQVLILWIGLFLGRHEAHIPRMWRLFIMGLMSFLSFFFPLRSLVLGERWGEGYFSNSLESIILSLAPWFFFLWIKLPKKPIPYLNHRWLYLYGSHFFVLMVLSFFLSNTRTHLTYSSAWFMGLIASWSLSRLLAKLLPRSWVFLEYDKQ